MGNHINTNIYVLLEGDILKETYGVFPHDNPYVYMYEKGTIYWIVYLNIYVLVLWSSQW